MTEPGDRKKAVGSEKPGGVCDRCRQPARLAYHPEGTRGVWLCPACLAKLDSLEGGSEVRKIGVGEGASWQPGPGAWVGCALIACLLVIWAFLVLVALLHRH